MSAGPAVYRRGGNEVRMCHAIADSGLGRVLLAGTEQGRCAVLLGEDPGLLQRELREESPAAVFKRESLATWQAAALSCQDEDPLLSMLPVSLRGRIFQASLELPSEVPRALDETIATPRSSRRAAWRAVR
jgi:AraC family transcriptional regulator, regulatory protein of adaptative response / methylated-DNA-[protein]-cysteine methyltransferase